MLYILYCEAQARVRQGSARDGPQGERPQILNPCIELTLKLIASASVSDSTKISTVALAISASTISSLKYFDHGEIIYGDTSWIEDNCPDTFS